MSRPVSAVPLRSGCRSVNRGGFDLGQGPADNSTILEARESDSMASVSRTASKSLPEPPARRRRRRSAKADRTKEAIKQAIRDLIAEKGLRRLRLNDIYRRAGITSGAFYFHFNSKEAAFEEAAVDIVHDIYQSYTEIEWTDDLFSDICRLIRAVSEIYLERPLVMQALINTLYASPKVFHAFLKERNRLTQLLVQRIRAARRKAGNINQLEATTAEFLLGATTNFLENVFLSRYPELQGLRKAPDEVQMRISVFWYQLIMRADPADWHCLPDAHLLPPNLKSDLTR